MSNETTNPVVKWILIGVIVVSVCVVGAFVLLGTYPAGEYRVAKELEKRGFVVEYERQSNNIWKYPVIVIGENLSITEDDSRLLCQLSHIQILNFLRCDLSGWNLDEIRNCRELKYIHSNHATHFPIDEIGKLAACPVTWLGINTDCLNDSNLVEFAKLTNLEYLYLEKNAGITDAGLDHLEKIASLQYLGLTGTSVTQEGVDEFKKKRPGVEVEF